MQAAAKPCSTRASPAARLSRARGCPHRQRGVARPRAAAGSDGKESQARVLQQVEASAAIIDEMMGEIAREMFLGAAVSHVMESAEAGSSPSDVVAQVVGQRLEQLDSSFVATLDAYIQGASDKGAADVAEVLLMVRDEVMRRLGERLPPEMQLLEAALAAADSQGRMALLQQYAALSPDAVPPSQARPLQQQAEQQEQHTTEQQRQQTPSGGSSSVGASLHCLAVDLERAASQVISDMELMLEVPDRRLLAKLVLLREEVQQMLVEASFLGTAGSQTPEEAAMQLPFRQLGAIPRSCAVFLQRLMALAAPEERRALLAHALQEDREGLPAEEPGADSTNFERLRAIADRPQDWVRPGRLMQSVNALQHELLHGGGGAEPATWVAPSDVMLERLESIRRETLSVLLDIAGEGQPYLP